MSNISSVIILHPNDDVAIARFPVNQGDVISERGVVVLTDVKEGHKIALRDIAIDQAVKRYNQIIGYASQPIKAGEHIHLHNLKMGDYGQDYAFCVDKKEIEPAAEVRTFMGYRRANGKVATRNYIGILTSVNCSATVAKAMEEHFKSVGLADYPNIDGIVALPQSFGCAMDMKGDLMKIMQRTMSGYANHANFAGVLIVGLGCESNQIKELIKIEAINEGPMLQHLTIQETGGTQKTLNKGIEIIEGMLSQANNLHREKIPVSELIVALECGGSDSYSGISANPALGYAVDLLIQQGGTAILAETPEIYGAEYMLTRRAVSPQVGQKLINRIRWWEDYAIRCHAELNNNPSAGNKEGGLTTILEKSLGAIAKAGSSNLVDVYEYAEPVTAKGLVFMDTPGYDAFACTGQIAGGANVMCFTTGRGSAYGGKPTPCIKIASNNFLWRRQEEDMDINCGDVADGLESLESAGRRIFEMIINVASGEKSKSEKFGYGSLEFVPWQPGAIM
ncbi:MULTISPECIES: altronate dehydratase family protein [unclassified Brenneria]|uniref:UxaA family hydrolase n=1 Tax=unclassified Brenneria TaxID=2634434 RepID=UPI0029C59607|nr:MULTISPECIES: altronate dehydratase family protein [unclassified Brenneria]MDX5628807.1 altronate dehydratase family protein [Brenneria sp. L3-3Z]MDX5695946.1 altronate dehydratase family protein [Brenneria sp. L4-2C]